MKQAYTKQLKALSAAIIMAMAGTAAHAATIASFNVGISGTLSGSHSATGNVSGSGTATLNDAGVLTISMQSNYSVTTKIKGNFSTLSFATNSTDAITGTFNGVDTLSGNSGSSTISSCTDNSGTICSGITLNSGNTFSSITDPVVFNLAARGTTAITISDQIGSASQKYNVAQTYTLTTVPVPATGWLFGSGLIGMAVVARKRRNG